MQDPFKNTPIDILVTTLAETIEINILEMIGEKAHHFQLIKCYIIKRNSSY